MGLVQAAEVQSVEQMLTESRRLAVAENWSPSASLSEQVRT